MKRAPLTYRKSAYSKEKQARIQAIERDFHIRAFGEELARVNLDLTIEERHRYLEWMRKTAREGRSISSKSSIQRIDKAQDKVRDNG